MGWRLKGEIEDRKGRGGGGLSSWFFVVFSAGFKNLKYEIDQW